LLADGGGGGARVIPTSLFVKLKSAGRDAWLLLEKTAADFAYERACLKGAACFVSRGQLQKKERQKQGVSVPAAQSPLMNSIN